MLDAAEHGHDFYVEMSNIFREMGEEKYSLVIKEKKTVLKV